MARLCDMGWTEIKVLGPIGLGSPGHPLGEILLRVGKPVSVLKHGMPLAQERISLLTFRLCTIV